MSDATVVAASRDWVCVRLATYEDESEYEVLSDWFGDRAVANTVFKLLAPDGETPLSLTTRGPSMLLGSGGSARRAQRTSGVRSQKTRPPASPRT